MDQAALAQRLLDEMDDALGEEYVTVADLLDALGCAGLELREGGAATRAYFSMLREATS